MYPLPGGVKGVDGHVGTLRKPFRRNPAYRLTFTFKEEINAADESHVLIKQKGFSLLRMDCNLNVDSGQAESKQAP